MTRARDVLNERTISPALFLAGYCDPPRGIASSPFAVKPTPWKRRSRRGPLVNIISKERDARGKDLANQRFFSVKLACGHSYRVKLSWGCKHLRCKSCAENEARWAALP
jgi:hypothetical protein